MEAERYNGVRIALLALLTGVVGLALPGCERDARLAGRNIPENVQVHTVTHYGQTLDENASPEQVAFVLLRAVADDFEAKTPEAREKALAVQFDICAAGALAKSKSPSRLLDEHIYNVVYHWTPTISHYIPDFPKDWASAQSRLVRRDAAESAAGEECEVRLQVDDPDTIRDGKPDPNASVVIVIWMVKDGGYWRVTHPGFEQRDRPLERRQVLGAEAGRTPAATEGAASVEDAATREGATRGRGN
jgi:hypothetical protein